MRFDTLQQELDELKRQGLYRTCRSVEAMQGGRIQIEGRWLIHLASNSYLGLHQHPAVKEAALEAIRRYGAGATSARLVSGTTALTEALEEQLARFKGTESALLFSTGYMANLGVVTCLVGPGDAVVCDRASHASLVDAARLSRAALRVYRHRDANQLEQILRLGRPRYRRQLVVTEGVFSMDGDIAPLDEIVGVCRKQEAWLLVDDAHGTGVLGEQGRGALEHFGMTGDETVLQMGTLSKALGTLGGYLAAPRVVIEQLKNKARSFIYTTAPAPSCVAGALAALRVMEREPIWRQRLWENSHRWVSGLKEAGYDLISEETPIVPIRVGGNAETTALSGRLLEAGVYAPGIRPPTVPAGAARIRTSVTALHTQEDLDVALKAFEEITNNQISSTP